MSDTYNRVVYAVVERTPDVSDKIVVEAFKEHGWACRDLAGRQYQVHVPLYCARRAALDAAREEIGRFSESVAPLLIHELRVPEKPLDTRAMRVVRPVRMTWWERVCTWVTGRALWEVAAGRRPRLWSAGRPEDLSSAEEQRAAKSTGGDPPLTATQRRMSLLFMMISIGAAVVSVMILGMEGGALLQPPTPVILIAVFGALSSIAAGVFMGANRRSWTQKFGLILLSVAMYIATCVASWAVLSVSEGMGLHALPFALAGLVAAALVSRGLTHLRRLQPVTKAAWSLAGVSSFAALSVSIGAGIVWMVLADWGVPFEEVQQRQAAVIVVGIGAGVVLLASALSAGALWGWAEYFRLFGTLRTVELFLRVWIVVILMLLLTYILLLILLGAWGDANKAPGEGRGNIFYTRLLERTCVREIDSAAKVQRGFHPPLGRELTIIRGSGHTHWYWSQTGESPEDGVFRPFDADHFELVGQCDAGGAGTGSTIRQGTGARVGDI